MWCCSTIFPGEQYDRTYRPGADLLVKSHHVSGHRLGHPRDPLPWRIANLRALGGEAVLLLRSPWRAVRSSWNHLHMDAVDTDLDTPKFHRFVLEEARRWREVAVDWLLTSPRLHVVHYEHLKEDTEQEIRRIVTFLRLEPDEQRLACMRDQRFEGFLRKHKKQIVNPYRPEAMAALQEAADYVQQLLEATNQPPLPFHLYSM